MSDTPSQSCPADDSTTVVVPETMPAVRGGVAPYLCVEGADKAARFYEKALAAETVFAQPLDEQGRTMHVHLYINGGSVMLSDPYPDYGHPFEKHQGYSLLLAVDDADAWFDRAVAAGAEAVMPVADQFWGDRYGQVRDPFGVMWAFASPILK